MTNDFTTTAQEMGQKYWDLLQNIKSVGDVVGILGKTSEDISKLENTLQKFTEDSIMRTRIQDQIDQLKVRKESIKKADEEYQASRKGLLELTAAQFEIDPKGEQKLDKSYIQAINHLLLYDPKDRMEFHECIIAPEGICATNDEVRTIVTCANICHFVREAANKKLGKDTTLKDLWDHVVGTENMFKVYSILAQKGTIMDAKEISNTISDPNWDRVKVKNNLNNLLLDNIFTQKLIMRVEKGKYKISDIGRFLWQEYGPMKKENDGERNGPQTALNRWVSKEQHIFSPTN